MQLAVKIIWIVNCLRLLKFPFCQFEGLKEVPVFEIKLWTNGKRTRLHFWMRESSNCVEHTEKENFHFPIVPHTFLRLGCPVPKFRQTCTTTQKQLIFRGFLWIPCAKKTILRPFTTYVKPALFLSRQSISFSLWFFV